MKYLTEKWRTLSTKSTVHEPLRPDERASKYDEALFRKLYQKEYQQKYELARGAYLYCFEKIKELAKGKEHDECFLSEDEYVERLAYTKEYTAKMQKSIYPDAVHASVMRWTDGFEALFTEGLSPDIWAQIADLRVLSLGVVSPALYAAIKQESYASRLAVTSIIRSYKLRQTEIEHRIPKNVKKYFYRMHDTIIKSVEHNGGSIRIHIKSNTRYNEISCIVINSCEIVRLDPLPHPAYWEYQEFDIEEDGRYYVCITFGPGLEMCFIAETIDFIISSQANALSVCDVEKYTV